MTGFNSMRDTDPPRPNPTPNSTMNGFLETLSSRCEEWVKLPVAEKITLLEQVMVDFRSVWPMWSDYSVRAKGIAERKAGNDKEWLEIAPINRLHSMMLKSLKAIEKGRKPRVAGGYRVLQNGQVSARVYPDSLAHTLAFRNITIDVRLEPDTDLEEAKRMQAAQYFASGRKGRVALVLGAGNASTLPSSDMMHKLFVDQCVIILKMNPVNAYLGPLLEMAYQALIERGFLRIAYGGAEEGEYLVKHPLVDEVHMTGSDRTFDAIVFGNGEEGRQRKEDKNPRIKKPVDGELGCITPWIIVPGDWSPKQIEQQAARMAFWMTRHEGYICFSPRILILRKGWKHRQSFLDALQQALKQVVPIEAYYPGSENTQKEFVQMHPDAIQIGGDDNGRIPWTIIPNLDPNMKEDICFRRESFSGLCGEITLEANSIAEYLEKAVEFLNDTVWGTLSATIVVSEKSMKKADVNAAVEWAIEHLHYGTVALNGPGTLGFYTMIAPWGGFPGSTIFDIQSGISRVTNALMLHRPQKTVVRAPFTWWPYPFLGTAKNLDVFCRKLALFEANPRLYKLPGLFLSALAT